MADMLTKCPKCGGNLTTRGPKYCDAYYPTVDTNECEHGVKGEHLYTQCECGYVTNIRPCEDAEKKDGR